MIGVFDSGLGGLTAFATLREILPNADIVYFGDTGRVPYGSRSAEIITKYAEQAFTFLESRGVGSILAACGTVSSVALPLIEGKYKIPIAGVLQPAAKAAFAATKNNIIGVIATSATISSGAYEFELAKLCKNAKVISHACPLLVPLVENGYIGRNCEITRLALKEYLAPIIAAGADTLILGCTHYPIISDIISDIIPGVTLINSGREAALAIADLTDESVRKGSGKTEIFVSDNPKNFEAVAEIFLGAKPDAKINRIEIEKYI